MEVAGVFLGAVALIFPVYEGLGRLRDRLFDAKNFPRDFQRLGWNLFTQKKPSSVTKYNDFFCYATVGYIEG